MKLTWAEIESVVAVGKSNVLISGGPSTGKSFMGQKYSRYAITANQGMSGDEIRGHFVPEKGGFVWHDGIGLRAWREGVNLTVNELPSASDELMSMLYVFSDNPETAQLTLPTGETVRPKDGYKMIATMNGDPMDGRIPEALLTRFPIRIEVNEPHPDALAKIPQQYREYARSMACCEPERAIALRSWYAFVDLADKLGQEIALKSVFGERYDEILDALTLNKYGRDDEY